MKSKFTLTKLFTLAILLVSFTVVSASTGSDDSCKTKCCKNKKAKNVSVAAEMDKALAEMEADIEYVTAVAVTKHVQKSLRKLRFKNIIITPKTPVLLMAFDAADETKDVDPKQKINFNALDKEMSQVQEDLSKMDDCLKNDDAKNRKAAEEILKTGIKS